MTQKEFLQLEIGMVVSNRFDQGVYFEIFDIDQMGTAHRGKRYRVYGAKQMDCDTHFARIDINNCQFWNIDGALKRNIPD